MLHHRILLASPGERQSRTEGGPLLDRSVSFREPHMRRGGNEITRKQFDNPKCPRTNPPKNYQFGQFPSRRSLDCAIQLARTPPTHYSLRRDPAHAVFRKAPRIYHKKEATHTHTHTYKDTGTPEHRTYMQYVCSSCFKGNRASFAAARRCFACLRGQAPSNGKFGILVMGSAR